MTTTAPTEQQQHELTIPIRFGTLFRRALIDEVETSANWVTEQAQGFAKEYDERPEELDDVLALEARRDRRVSDLRTASRQLSADFDLLERLAADSDGDPDTVRGSFATLHDALEGTMRLAADALVSECRVAPIDGGRAVHRSSAAIWAAGEIERLKTEAAR